MLLKPHLLWTYDSPAVRCRKAARMSEQDPPPLSDPSFPQEPPPPTLPTTEPAGRWRLVAVLVILVVGAAAAGFLLLRDRGDGPAAGDPPQPQVVATFRGNGNQRTDAFTVDSGWEIRWTTRGKRFAIAVTGAEDLGTVVEQRGKQTGATFPRGAGEFRLDVTARGPWRIQIRNNPAASEQP